MDDFLFWFLRPIAEFLGGILLILSIILIVAFFDGLKKKKP